MQGDQKINRNTVEKRKLSCYNVPCKQRMVVGCFREKEVNFETTHL